MTAGEYEQGARAFAGTAVPVGPKDGSIPARSVSCARLAVSAAFPFSPSPSSNLKTMESEAGALQGVIGRASQLAESVSCKVRVLDQAKV